LLTFSYSGLYFDTITGEEVTVGDHSGTGRHYASYKKTDTCSGVATAAAKLDQLVERIVELNPAIRIDIISHSMGGLVTAYLLATSDGEHLDHIATVTTLDSPIQGTNLVDGVGLVDSVWDVSVCLSLPRSTQAHLDLLPLSSVVNVISTLRGSARAETFYSIKSELQFGAVSVGSPLPDEPVWVVKCGGNLPQIAHSCVWFDEAVLTAISGLVNQNLPVVHRLRWTSDSGDEIQVIDRGETVRLTAVFGNIQDSVVGVTIYEVDPDSPDDFVIALEMKIIDGVGSVKWVAEYQSDFFGFGGDPEYKFVILNTSSGELVVR
jgi:pimeloyl-ACP methyl ester carboxylesterase